MVSKRILKNKKSRFIFIILSVSVVSIIMLLISPLSTNNNLSHYAYIEAIEKSSTLKVEKKISDIKYQCFLMPSDYNAIKLMKPNMPFQYYKDALNNASGFVYFKFTLKSTDGNEPILVPSRLNENVYGQRLEYFNTYAQSNFKLITDKDTINCSQYLFENPYNLLTDVNILGAFQIKHPLKSQDLQLIYDDQLFNNGLIKFYFSKNDLNELPELIKN